MISPKIPLDDECLTHITNDEPTETVPEEYDGTILLSFPESD